ncbi:MAG: rhodanese-like domain-containing protein [Myxococcota bacterium]
MTTTRWMMALALVGCAGEGEEPGGGAFARFITVDELARDPGGFAILDVREAEAYAADHLPGAVNAPWQTFAGVGVGEPGDADWGTLLPASEIAAALGALGVDPGKPLVTYADPTGWGEDGRVAWSLESAGFPVRMLDGGFPAWVNTGNEATSEVPSLSPTTFAVAEERLAEINVTTAQMLAAVEAGDTLILDARETEEYDGAMLYGELRGGHIPGAVSQPFVESLNGDGTMKPDADLRAMFEAAGVVEGETVYVYCTKGIRSAHTWAVLTHLGFDARNYDASFYSWAGDETLPIE